MRISRERLDQDQRMGDAASALYRLAEEHGLSEAEFLSVLSQVLHSLLGRRAHEEPPATDDG